MWVFKQLSMFWLKAKQEKQRKTNIVRIFMKCYALSVNFILFYDFDLKSENVMFFHDLCQVAGLRKLLIFLRYAPVLGFT